MKGRWCRHGNSRCGEDFRRDVANRSKRPRNDEPYVVNMTCTANNPKVQMGLTFQFGNISPRNKTHKCFKINTQTQGRGSRNTRGKKFRWSAI